MPNVTLRNSFMIPFFFAFVGHRLITEDEAKCFVLQILFPNHNLLLSNNSVKFMQYMR